MARRWAGDPDADWDGDPGNSSESKEYSQRYRTGEAEWSNELPGPDRVEEYYLQREDADYVRNLERALQHSVGRVQELPIIGRVVLPKDDSYAASAQIIRNPELAIGFDATKHMFDKTVAQAAQRPDIFDPTHPDYAKYAVLRDQLAIVSNIIAIQYDEDNVPNSGDEKYHSKLSDIAEDIGHAIRADQWRARVTGPSISPESLNVEGEGAANLYKYLLSRQTGTTWLGRQFNILRRMFGQPAREWMLAPLEETPFSPENLAKPAPKDELCSHSPEQLKEYCSQLNDRATALEQKRNDVGVLKQPEKKEAVAHGHIILDWLRNIRFSDKSVQDMLDTGTPTERAEEADKMQAVISKYRESMDEMLGLNPSLIHNPKVQEAQAAIETMEHAIQLMAKLEKPVSLAETMQISTDVTQQPEHWHRLKNHTVERLSETAKGGLEDALHSLNQQEQDIEQQQEEEIESAVEAALMASDQSRRRRRRRKQVQGQTAKRQQKIDRDIRADDRVLKQGVYSEQNTRNAEQRGDLDVPVRNNNVRPEQLGVVREIGRLLMQNGNAGRDLEAQMPVADVNAIDPLKPDNQSFVSQQAQRDQQQRTSTRRNNRQNTNL